MKNDITFDDNTNSVTLEQRNLAVIWGNLSLKNQLYTENLRNPDMKEAQSNEKYTIRI